MERYLPPLILLNDTFISELVAGRVFMNFFQLCFRKQLLVRTKGHVDSTTPQVCVHNALPFCLNLKFHYCKVLFSFYIMIPNLNSHL